MKKRFVTSRRKKHKFVKKIFFFLLFVLSLIVSFHFLSKSNIVIDDRSLVEVLLNPNEVSFKSIVGKKIKNLFSEPVMLLDNNYFKNVSTTTNDNSNVKKVEKPIIYIYNSHQGEEYAHSTFAEFSVQPTVMFADYALEHVFNKNNYQTMVEEASIKEILNINGWRYAYSYMASRILLENAKSSTPSLKYFIDVHRDSLERERTTVTIGDKVYAKTIFLIGLENEKYEENLAFTEEINSLMNTKYPNLSKGIYKKGGAGVNGVYNQDFSNRTILIEIGGYENTPSEVLNSVLAFADCFMEVISKYEKG